MDDSLKHPLDTSRRDFFRKAVTTATVAGVGVPGIGAAAAKANNGRGPLKGDPFTLGVASGDPLPNSVVLWTRLAPEPLSEDGGMPDREVTVQWKIATDEEEDDDESPFGDDFPFEEEDNDESPFGEDFPFGDDDNNTTTEETDGDNEKIEENYRVVHTGTARACPKYAHSVHIDVRGLDPNTEYYYQFKIGPDRSSVGRTKTAPAEGADVEEFKFAFNSCQNYPTGYYTAHNHLADEDLDLAIQLGDCIYEDGAQGSLGRGHEPPREIASLSDYRIRHAQYKTDPNLQDAHAACPWLVTWDDHEVENNYADATSQDNDPTQEFLERRANAYQAYFEHQPLRPSRMPDGPNLPLYRRFTFGDLAEFNVLDTRQYRDDQVDSSEKAANPGRTILGDKQEGWLVKGLNDSTSRWNVLTNQVPFAATDESPNPDVRNFGGGDKWDGYRADRKTLLDVMAADSELNPIVITGDVHRNYAYNLKADFSDPDSETVGTEYVGTSISSFGDGSGRTLFDSSEGEPWRRFFNNNRGYVRCTLTPEKCQTDYRVVSTVEEPEASVSTVASFVTEAGNPGATLDGVALSEIETQTMYSGKENPVSVPLINPTAEEIGFEVSIDVPEGWRSETPSTSTVLAPSSSETVELSVTPPTSLVLDEEVTWDTLRVTLAAEGVQVYGSPREVQVPVVPEPEGSNIALSAQTSASSTFPGLSSSHVIDGTTSSANWSETAWIDDTNRQFPDFLELQFSERQRVGRVDLYTIGSDQFPASLWGLRDWDVQLMVDDEWQTVKKVRDNENNPVISTFKPIETDAVRIRILAGNNGLNSPIIELEVYAGSKSYSD